MAAPAKSETPKPKRRARRRGPWLWIVLILLLAGGAYAYVARPWEPRVRAVATETVAQGKVTQVLAANGRIAARNSVRVRAAVQAQALAVLADEGDAVTEGEVIVRLDSSLIEDQVAQARAALEAQRAKQRQAEANVERARALGENTTRASREDAELALATATEETTRLEAALAQVQRQAQQYVIPAPISGIVLSRGVDQGQLIDAQTQLFVIADTTSLVVETDVDELYSARVMPGLKALLQPVGATVAQYGTVTFAAPAVDSSTGGRAIRIGFDEPVSLPIGLTVNANVIVNEVPDALSVPRSAIFTHGAESHVLVIADGVAATRPIVFDDWPAERVIVTSGLAAGDMVIIDPSGIEPGEQVRPQ